MATILFRRSLSEENEYSAAAKYFSMIEYRSEIKGGLIIPRYSSLPYYEELERDVSNMGGTLINSYAQHKYIANYSYYQDIKDFTFKSWKLGEFNIPDIPLVVKGATNSKKWEWNTNMFAENRKKAYDIASRLSKDSLVGTQDIIFKEYIPLKNIEIGLNGLPFSEEYRFFFYKNQLITGGFYWSGAETAEDYINIPPDIEEFARHISFLVKDNVNFYVIDVARKADNKPICIELNCGTMSGLSMISPDIFYGRLKEVCDQDM